MSQFNIVPKGKYIVQFDGKDLGAFGTLPEAQKFQSTLGKRGSVIITPNLRSQMAEKDISVAEHASRKFVQPPL